MLQDRVQGGDKVLRGSTLLYVVDRVEDEASAGGEYFQPLLHLRTDFLGGTKGEGPLSVHPAAPEGEPVSVLVLQFPGIHSTGGELYRIENVQPRIHQHGEDPQVCCQVFQGVFSWTHLFCSVKPGTKSSSKRAGSNISVF